VLVVWMALVSLIGASNAHASMPVGINMAPVYYFNTEWFFVDAMKSSSGWFPQLVNGGPWDTGAHLTLTADGYPLLAPGQAAACVMFVDIQGHYPGGNYICRYDGSGTIEFGGDAHIVSQTPGRIVVNVQPSNTGIVLRITATNNSNPVRNVRMIMPGFEPTYQSQPFHPTFIDRLSNYKVLRFMDWQRTNETTQQHWSQRTQANYRTQAITNGVAVEHMIKLCNTLGSDPWFCIPHTASDDYIRQFAKLVRDTLNPALSVYIEYSNETWNGGFQQAGYCQQNGLAMGLAGDPYLAGVRYHSLRSVQIFNIWKQEFGGQHQRVVRVLGAQHDNPWIGRQIMDFQNAYQHADCLAVAPYFGYGLGLPDQANQTAGMSIDQILNAAEADMLGNRRNLTIESVNDATSRGLRLIAYEGGQHLVGVGSAMSNATLNSKFWQANRHHRMGDLYMKDLNVWAEAGGDLFVEYSSAGRYTEWGSWGTFEWQNQPIATAPKYSAIQDFIAAGGSAPPKLRQYTGSATEERLGFHVAAAGDINNDGVVDILVSAPRADAGSPDGGHVFAYSGANGALLFYKVGQSAGEQFGYSAAGVGDVNADGHGDIVIGAWANNQNGAKAGKVYVYSGKTKSLLYSLPGPGAGSHYGFSVTRVGDVNGDGRPDFAVGAWGVNGNSGRVYIHSGSNGATLRTINGLTAGERLGYALAGVGDVSGDGVPDVIAGAPWGRNPANVETGRAYVIHANSGALYHTRYGESAGARFGRSVAWVGDVNGDGRADYGVGAFKSNQGGHQAGKAYVFSGTGPLLFSRIGAAQNHRFGLAISGIGDINFDGKADFAIGAHKAGGSGRVYIFAGGYYSTLAVYSGDNLGDKFGHSIGALGDVNADGRADFLVGAWGHSSGSYHAGRAYAISGLIAQASESLPAPEHEDSAWWLSVTQPLTLDELGLPVGDGTGSSGDALASSGGGVGASGAFDGGTDGGVAGDGATAMASESVGDAAQLAGTTYVTAPASELNAMSISLLSSQAAQIGFTEIERATGPAGEAPLRNSALVSPFDVGGSIEVDGDYIQTPRGVLAMHVGSDAGEHVFVSGMARLNGALLLTVDESADLELGDEFELVNASAVVGMFSVVYTPVTDDGLTFSVAVEQGRIVARVVEADSLPGAIDIAAWLKRHMNDAPAGAEVDAHFGDLPQWFMNATFTNF
jgi:hypothetical protein